MTIKKMLRTSAAICIICICFCLCRIQSHAENGLLMGMDVSFGYDNYQKNSRTMPIWVHITNNGADTEGTLTLNIIDGDYTNTSFSKQLSVGRSSETTAVFYVPCLSSYTHIEIQFSGSSGLSLTWSGKTMNRNTEDIYAGVLSDHFEDLTCIQDLVLSSEPLGIYQGMRAVDLTSHPLPEDMEGYDGIDLIIVSDFDASTLNDAQIRAIKQWVENGGLLYCSSGEQLSALWDALDISPLQPQDSQTVITDFNTSYHSFVRLLTPLSWEPLPENPTEEELDRLLSYTESADIGSTTYASIDPIAVETDILPESANEAIIVKPMYQKISCGQGSVIIFKFDLSSTAFNTWEMNRFVMQSYITECMTQSDWYHFMNYTDNFKDIWSVQSILLNTLNENLPKLFKYAIILLIYIVIAGPVLYIILKRKDRRYLLWPAVPMLSIFFMLIIFSVSAETRHQIPFLNYATYIKYTDNGALEDTYYSVTLPDKGKFIHHVPQDYDIHMINNNYSNSMIILNSYYVESQTNNNSGLAYNKTDSGTDIKIHNDSAFSARYFNTQKDDPEIGALEESVTYKDGNYVGTISNQTGYDISNACLIISGQIYAIGNIPDGVTADVNVSAKGVVSQDYDIERAIRSALNIPLDGAADGRERVQLNMLLQFINDNSYDNYAYVIGFADQYRTQMFSDTPMTEVNGMTMVQKQIRIGYESDSSGRIYIPDITQMMHVDSGDIYILTREIYSNELDISFDFKNTFLPETLTLTDSSEGAYTISAYNYTTMTYENIFTDSSKLSGEGLGVYFDDNKILKLKITCSIPNSVDFSILPAFSMTGRME